MQFRRAVSKIGRTLRNRSALRTLDAARDPAARAIADAVRSATSGTPGEEERRWMEQIAEERASLLSSSEALPVLTSLRWYGPTPDSDAVDEPVRDICQASVSPSVGLLLHLLIRKTKPVSCLEMGSCLGLSAAYQASALSLNGRGRLVTMEGQPAFADRARQTLDHLDLEDTEVITGRFQDTLTGVLSTLSTVDYAYIDGHHDEQATEDYFAQLLPHVTDGALLVFDDINWSDGMRRAWGRIADHPRVSVVADLYSVGVCAVRDREHSKVRVEAMYW